MSDGFSLRALLLGKTPRPVIFDEAVSEFKLGKTNLWMDIVAADPQKASDFLQNELGFHPLHVEDALSPHERPALSTDHGITFLVAPSVSSMKDGEHYIEVAFFVKENSIVTVSTQHCHQIDDWFEKCKGRPVLAGNSISLLLHSLLDLIVDGYYPALDAFSIEVEELEDAIYQGQKVSIADSLQLKRRLLEMRRRIAPMRDICNGLLRRESAMLSHESMPYFQDIYDHTLRIIEVVDMERDILSAVMDAHLSIQSNMLNQVMRSMTVIATLLMTGAFIAGVYGMNFDYMPELHWKYGYASAWAAMIVSGAIEIWIFKKKGWI
ncbi:MAG: magnesium/cobalt transporter CorA [Fimbriimonadaceae bacterium]